MPFPFHFFLINKDISLKYKPKICDYKIRIKIITNILNNPKVLSVLYCFPL